MRREMGMACEQPGHDFGCGSAPDFIKCRHECSALQMWCRSPSRSMGRSRRAHGAGGRIRQGGGVETGVVLAEGMRQSPNHVRVCAGIGEPDPYVLSTGRAGVSPQMRHSQLGQLRGETVRILAHHTATVAAAVEVEPEQAKPLVRIGEIDRPRKLRQLRGDGYRGAVAVRFVWINPDSSPRRPHTSTRLVEP